MPCVAVGVVVGQGFAQRRRVEPHLLGQLFKGVGDDELHIEAALHALLIQRSLIADRPDIAQTVPVHLVEHRAVELLGHVAAVLFIDEALAVRADEHGVVAADEAGNVRRGRRAVMLGHDFVILEHTHHVAGVGQRRADVAGHHNALARRAGEADAHRARLLRVKAHGQLRVVRIAAGRDDHAVRVDQQGIRAANGLHALHRAVLVHQDLRALGLKQQLNAGARQRIFHRGAHRRARAVHQMHHLQRAVADDHVVAEGHAQTLAHPVDRLAGALDGDRRQRRVEAVGGVAHQVAIHLFKGVMHIQRLGVLGLIAADHALAGRGRSADLRQLFEQHNARAVVVGLDRSRNARAARADNHNVRRHFNRLALRLLGLRRGGLERLDVRARLGQRLLGGGEDGLAGHGRARHGIHREALGGHNRGRDFLNRRVADSGGFRVLDNLNGGDRAALHGHGDLHRAADALTLAGVRSGRHLRRRAGGEQHHGARHNCDDFLLHGGSPFSFPSFSQGATKRNPRIDFSFRFL